MGVAAPVVETRAARLREARALLDRVSRTADRTRGAPAAGADVLPVAGPLRSLLPGGGLRRGGTVAVSSAGSLLFALLAEASAQGSWCALVGLPGLGLVAAEESGLVLSRVALVPCPGAELVGVTAALLDGIDLVAVAGVERLPAGARQRLAARARQRGTVLLPVGHWPGADLRVEHDGGRWHGLVGGGGGRLRQRRVRVRVQGRGPAHSGRSAELLLPGPEGAVLAVAGESVPMRSPDVREVG